MFGQNEDVAAARTAALFFCIIFSICILEAALLLWMRYNRYVNAVSLFCCRNGVECIEDSSESIIIPSHIGVVTVYCGVPFYMLFLRGVVVGNIIHYVCDCALGTDNPHNRNAVSNNNYRVVSCFSD